MVYVEESKKYSLNTGDGKKIGKGALIAVGSALVVYAAEILPQVDFKGYTPLAVALGAVLINLARKYLAGRK